MLKGRRLERYRNNIFFDVIKKKITFDPLDRVVQAHLCRRFRLDLENRKRIARLYFVDRKPVSRFKGINHVG